MQERSSLDESEVRLLEAALKKIQKTRKKGAITSWKRWLLRKRLA